MGTSTGIKLSLSYAKLPATSCCLLSSSSLISTTISIVNQCLSKVQVSVTWDVVLMTIRIFRLPTRERPTMLWLTTIVMIDKFQIHTKIPEAIVIGLRSEGVVSIKLWTESFEDIQ